MPGYKDAMRLKLRLRIAGFALLAAVGMAFFAFKFQSKMYLTSTPARRAARSYSRIWFDAADDLIGAERKGNILTLERWSGTNSSATWEFDIAPQDLWAFAADDSRIAWISGETLHWQSVAPGSRRVSVPLRHANPLALTILSSGAVAVAFDRYVDRWNSSSAEPEEWQSALPPADHAAAQGDYIALSSAQDGELRVFSPQGPEWIQAQQSLAPEIPDQVLLPAPGIAGALTAGRLRVNGVTRAAPGSVRSIAAHLYDVLATGDFDGVYVLSPDGESYHLADAAHGSIVACGETHFATSGAGTALFNLGLESRLTPKGRNVSYASLGALLLAIALLCAPLLLRILALLFPLILRPARQFRAPPSRFAQPPADLVQVCAEGQALLWAGAGLSAQSGFPLRAAFITTLLQSAIFEHGGMALARKLKSLAARGKHEAALNEWVTAMAAQRGATLAYFNSIYGRFSPPSRAHEFLARLSFPSAVTTNYDVLLERCCEDWAQNTIGPGEAPLADRFLFKLYGSLASPSSALLSQSEFQAALHHPNLDALRQTLAGRPFIFVGCSLEGLLADLSTLAMPEDCPRIRYAIAGVSGNWERTAESLLRRFQITVLPCAEDHISEALPEFLQALAQSVEEARHGSVPLVAKAAS